MRLHYDQTYYLMLQNYVLGELNNEDYYILKDLISEIRDVNSGETYLLSKPVFEHELAKKIFEEQSASGGKFTEVAYQYDRC